MGLMHFIRPLTGGLVAMDNNEMSSWGGAEAPPTSSLLRQVQLHISDHNIYVVYILSEWHYETTGGIVNWNATVGG